MKTENTSMRLKQIMTDRHLKQVDILEKCKPFCEKYGISMNKSDISQYVSGKNEPGSKKLTILGLALGVTETWLMGYDVPMNRDDSFLVPNELLSPSRVKALRIKNGLSQEELASKVNIPVSLYSEYENGASNIEESILVNIFEALNEVPDGFAMENGKIGIRLVGGNIHSQRENLKISIKQLSKETGIPVDVLESFEEETLYPSQQDLEIIAVILKTSADALLGVPGFILPDERTTIFTIDSKTDKYERNLLEEFRKLNEVGKKVAIERIHELSEVPKYTDNNEYLDWEPKQTNMSGTFLKNSEN